METWGYSWERWERGVDTVAVKGRPSTHIARGACGPHVFGVECRRWWCVCWLGSPEKGKFLKGGGPQTARGLGLVNPEPPQQQILEEGDKPTPPQPNRSGTGRPNSRPSPNNTPQNEAYSLHFPSLQGNGRGEPRDLLVTDEPGCAREITDWSSFKTSENLLVILEEFKDYSLRFKIKVTI
jgi:hypothetical protein